MRLVNEGGCALQLTFGDAELLRYVYLPGDPQAESPRPYFHPVRTLRGDLVTVYRPHDHMWHKGISWSLPNVGPMNFWGGPTYQRGHGYRQLANNGRIRHDSFGPVTVRDGECHLDEQLSWVTEPGETWFTERRRIGVRVLPGARAWVLSFATSMRNVRGASIRIGSPGTEGRDNAGYGGLFWRGPRSFTGGRVLTPAGAGGDECMGQRGPWMGFTGRHDGTGRASTVIVRDSPGNLGHPARWYVHSQPFACLCPAPFFDSEHCLTDAQALTLRYDVVVAEGELSAAACGKLLGTLPASGPASGDQPVPGDQDGGGPGAAQ